MNNYDLSIECFENIFKQCKDKLSKNDYNYIAKDMLVLAKTFQELVERATPKKVIKEKVIVDFDYNDMCCSAEEDYADCPNDKCEYALIDKSEDWDFEDYDFCPNCGQKLEWE